MRRSTVTWALVMVCVVVLHSPHHLSVAHGNVTETSENVTKESEPMETTTPFPAVETAPENKTSKPESTGEVVLDPDNGNLTQPELEALDTTINTTGAPHSISEQADSALLEEAMLSEEPEEEAEGDEGLTSDSSDPPTLERSARQRLPAADFLDPFLFSVYTLGGQQVSGALRNANCGLQITRIIGGSVARVGGWPWAVVVKDKYDIHFCGAVLISPRHILTAAHCIGHPELQSRFPLKVTVGDNDLSTTTESVSTTSWVLQALEHSQYNYPTAHNNDVGVLVVENPIDTQDNVAPVCLPSASLQLPVGTRLWVIGWGATMEGGPVVNVIREAEVMLLDHSACQTAYPNLYKSDRMLCVGDPAGGTDACQGDSGGPLLYKDDGRWYVVGVVGFGTGCGRAQYPGVYASVPFHLGLINWAINNV